MARRRIAMGKFTGFGGVKGSPLAPFSPFTPYGTPPTGSYDPALDAAASAAGRGLGDLTQDTGQARERLTTDYNLARSNLLQGQQRNQEDHDRAIAMLTRNYQQLANRQAQGQARAGVIGGGAVLQAAAKRAANKALEQQPIDTALTRSQQDTDSALGQLALQMAPPDANNPLGGRQFQDLNTQLTRGQRENTYFGLDTAAEKAYQAGGAGWEPGVKPKNEYIGPQGPYRLVRRGNRYYRINPNGSVRSSRPL